MKTLIASTILAALGTTALADMHGGGMLTVEAMDQDVSAGTVTADRIVAEQNGWLVVHRTDAEMAPGPVVGHAPLRAGESARGRPRPRSASAAARCFRSAG
jgi:hypothetical protein